jgi:hypothetical protein
MVAGVIVMGMPPVCNKPASCCCCACLPSAPQPGVASAEVVSSWTDFSKSPYIREQKVIFHKGEVGHWYIGGMPQRACRGAFRVTHRAGGHLP